MRSVESALIASFKCLRQTRTHCCSFVLLLLVAASASAQQDPSAGIQPFSTQVGGQYDSIDLASSNIYLSIPILQKTGKIPFSFQLTGNFHAYTWAPPGDGIYQTEVSAGVIRSISGIGQPGGALWLTSNAADLGVWVTGTVNYITCILADQTTGYGEVFDNFAVVDETGAAHGVNLRVQINNTPGIGCGAAVSGPGIPGGSTTGSEQAGDGSGYQVAATLTNSGYSYSLVVYDRSGNMQPVYDQLISTGAGVAPPYPVPNSTVTDPDGVQASVTGSNTTTVTYTDTLGTTPVLTVSPGAGWSTTGAPDVYTYYDATGKAQSIQVNYTQYTQRTNFACGGSGFYDFGPATAYFPTSVVLADGETYQLSYEVTPGYPNDITGRLAQITLPNKGYIAFGYLGNGCNHPGCVQTLTRTINDNNGNSGTWTYTNTVHNHQNYTTTTVTATDPAGNVTTYQFYGGLQYEKIVTDKNLGTLSTTITCYNGNNSSQSNCLNPTPQTFNVSPLVQTDVYTTLGSSSSPSLVETVYDYNTSSSSSIGDVLSVKKWDFGATYPPSGTPAAETDTTYANVNGVTCGSISAYIFDHPCSVTTYSNNSMVSQTIYRYNTGGHPIQTSTWVSGSTYLYSNASYNSNGTIASSTDVNGAITNYYYNGSGGCNNFLLTSTVSPVNNLTTSQKWSCTAGVLTSSTDENGQVTTYGYFNQNSVSDPLSRVLSVTDPLNNTTWTTYSPGGTLPATVETALVFNNGTSTTDILTTMDGLGRPYLKQTREKPAPYANFDTVVTTYDALGRVAKVGLPCVSTASQPCTSAVTTTTYDALNRSLQVQDGGGGYISNTYSANDVLTVRGPAPSGENTESGQDEYDGLGRLTKSCAIGNGSSTACGQNTGSANGVTTSYSYTYATGSSTLTATRGSQSRSKTYDALGRLISVTTPEGGTTRYVYDTASATCYNIVSKGDLVEKIDNAGVHTCYGHDALHRVTGYGAVGSSSTYCPNFTYGDQTYTPPSGVTITNGKGRVVEAYTSNTCNSVKTTDEWFSYDADGRITDMWEMTPHSTQYYHSKATFAGNGDAVTSLQLASPSLYTMTWGLDGEGRWDTLTDTTTSKSLVAGPTTGGMYDAAGRVLNVRLTGTTPDQDIYTYDPNTGRMQTFEFEVGNSPANLTGTLTWNANGTLAALHVVDGFNAGGSETCYSNSSALPLQYGYDDWGRLVEFDCGSGNWGQQYSYDIYDNLTKTVISGRTGTTWNPGYNSSTNHCNGCTYDSNGDVTGDGNDVYGWNEFSKVKWTAASGTPTCGSSGRCAVYDAFGSMVEQSNGSTWTERWITQLGETAYMNGASANYAYWPSPGSGRVIIYGNSTNYGYLHPDWLGNARITSNLANNTVTTDQAYTPYGELYNIFGSGSGQYEVFATMTGDFAPGATTPIMWDTPNRELSMVGRWLSPDPAGAGWNQYAYVTNPLIDTDPLGLGPCPLGFTPSATMSGVCISLAALPQVPCQFGSACMPKDPAGTADYHFNQSIAQSVHQDWLRSFCLEECGNIPLPVYAENGCGGPNPACVPANNGFTVGIRAPGQTFNDCMQANAGNYSLLGVADFALNANGQIANNFWLGFTPGSNTITNYYNAAAGSLTSLFQAGRGVVTAGMGTVVTSGRRTSSIMSLNLPGTPGGPKGGFPALGRAPSNAARAAKAGSVAFKLAVDAGFFLAEGFGCMIRR